MIQLMILADLTNDFPRCWIMAVGNRSRELFDKFSGDFPLPSKTSVRKSNWLVGSCEGAFSGQATDGSP